MRAGPMRVMEAESAGVRDDVFKQTMGLESER